MKNITSFLLLVLMYMGYGLNAQNPTKDDQEYTKLFDLGKNAELKKKYASALQFYLKAEVFSS